MRSLAHQNRQQILSQTGVLLVVRDPVPPPVPAPGQPPFVSSKKSEGVEILVAVWDDSSITSMHGHVDLGTGLRTALTQIVAEELNISPERVSLLMGSTSAAPNQGATIASASIQIHAMPLQKASAQAHFWALQQCVNLWGCQLNDIEANNGEFLNRKNNETLTWKNLLEGKRVTLNLDLQTPLKDPESYRLIGTDFQRVDIPSKVKGDFMFVHDMRVPGMLHGRVIRPPYAGFDSGDFIGKTLIDVDESSIAHIPGIKAVVVKGDFVGIVAEREEHAEQAMRELVVHWRDWPGKKGLNDTEQSIRNNPFTQRVLINEGDVEQAIGQATHLLERTYVWPYQMHASIGPSCALAMWCTEEEFKSNGYRARVWAGTQNPHVLRADLALIAGVSDEYVEVIRMEAAGCYGRNCADDVAADALILSRATFSPVRVQLTREQENVWEPKGAAQLMQVRGGLNHDNSVAGYDFVTSYPSNASPTLALLLTRTIEPVARTYEMGDRTAKPPYGWDNLRVTVNDMPPILRASWLRGVSAMPNTFAHESFVDELASIAKEDPVEFRLKWINDERARELISMTAEKANWLPHHIAQQKNSDGPWLNGQGFAYARYVHSKWPGFGAAYAAWVADVKVNKDTGEVHVKKVVVGHDAGLLINPKGVEQQVHGNIIQTTSRSLSEKVQTDTQTGQVLNLDWGSYPIINFRNVPMVEVYHMPRPGEPSLGAGESSSVPGTAAIANAIFDAIGVRLTQPPFTSESVREAMNPSAKDLVRQQSPMGAEGTQPALEQLAKRNQFINLEKLKVPFGVLSALKMGLTNKGFLKGVGFLFLGFLSSLFVYSGFQSELPRVGNLGNSSLRLNPRFDESLVNRGRELVALGNCVGCHTQNGGLPFAGGRSIQTPFGRITTPNLTPDVETGIGGWSFAAFERAMRQGISRDGHYLYPAFPYTSFQKINEEDMLAIYAWLMSRTPVFSQQKDGDLRFPFNQRKLMPIWNSLFANQNPTEQVYDIAPSEEFFKGKYLVESLGHCGECHSSRNALGAMSGETNLSGAFVDGWYAPALNSKNHSPIPWSKKEIFDYLSTGRTSFHGIAGGPMAQIVRELNHAPSTDRMAMAEYLSIVMNPKGVDSMQIAQIAVDTINKSISVKEKQSSFAINLDLLPGLRQFNGSCSSCHHDGDGPQLLGTNLHLSLNSNLHAESPVNLIRIILEGVREPASRELGFMPSFKDNLTDQQLSQIISYMRQRFAPEKSPWENLDQSIQIVRKSIEH